MPLQESNLEDYIDSLRSHIKADLINLASKGQLTLDEAKIIAKSAADTLPYTLTTKEQVVEAVENLKKSYPKYENRIKAALILCDVEEARKIIDSQVLPQIQAGNLDAALEMINNFKFPF